MTRVLAVGECLIGLTRNSPSTAHLAFAGGTCNTAVYLARLSRRAVEVRYLTATGDDQLSGELLGFLDAEGVTADVKRVPGASPSLYVVSTEAVAPQLLACRGHKQVLARLAFTGVTPSDLVRPCS
ncbi:PfkB family carbohydrate kinase [Microbacterium sp. NPDC058062]|uniref:PfkB family carbohydrate kinase n=1 Tax=Microbacterium sp. NPDC058062 TaxID=3346320 RepID=UPI0036DAD2C6